MDGRERPPLATIFCHEITRRYFKLSVNALKYGFVMTVCPKLIKNGRLISTLPRFPRLHSKPSVLSSTGVESSLCTVTCLRQPALETGLRSPLKLLVEWHKSPVCDAPRTATSPLLPPKAGSDSDHDKITRECRKEEPYLPSGQTIGQERTNTRPAPARLRQLLPG